MPDNMITPKENMYNGLASLGWEEVNSYSGVTTMRKKRGDVQAIVVLDENEVSLDIEDDETVLLSKDFAYDATPEEIDETFMKMKI